MSNELNEKLNEIIRKLYDMDMHLSQLEEDAGIEVQSQKNELEKIEKSERVNIRKKYILTNQKKALKLIENGDWIFGKAQKNELEDGFVWNCYDKDGIKVIGIVDIESSTIVFVFNDENIEIDSKYSIDFEHELAENLRTEILRWRETKRVYIKSEEIRNKYSYDKSNNKTDSSAKCIYCGSSTAFEMVCDSCRERYQKKRRGVGGYPAYDPNAQGSNQLKTQNKK